MSNGTKVKKRNGSIETLDLEKMHVMVDEATRGLAGVSDLVKLRFSPVFNSMMVSLQQKSEILIKSAADLISLDAPNYQFVAARLLLFAVRKQIYGKIREFPNLLTHIDLCIERGVYDKSILQKYTAEEIAEVNEWIDHDRDLLFTYAGLRQVVDKYLVQDRSSGVVYETPQFMYIMIALTIFAEYPKETRLNYVRRYYNAISKHRLNIPTPIMAGVRTPLRQFASCVLVDVDDTLDSIFSSDMVHWQVCRTRDLVSALTLAESVASTAKLEVERYNTQVWSPSLKSLKQLSDAAHRTASEVVLLQFTFYLAPRDRGHHCSEE